MKQCPKCNKSYDDNIKACLHCKCPLIEKIVNPTGIDQIVSISLTPLPAFYLKTIKNKTSYDDSAVEKISKKKFSVTYKMELYANNYCRAKIWTYEDEKFNDYFEIEDANGNYLNPLTFYEFCFSDLYSDEEQKALEGVPFLTESLACSYLFRTNELIIHLNRGRYDEISSLITREIPLDAILFRLNITDFKNFEQFHSKSISPSDHDYYYPSKRYRKFGDHKNHLWWKLEIVDFTEKVFPPIRENGDTAKNNIDKEKIMKYALKETQDISKIANEKKYEESYARILALEKLLDENDLEKSSIYSLKATLAEGYICALFAVGANHISQKEWIAATAKHIEVKDFILGNTLLLGLNYDNLVNFMAKLETDLKRNENVSDLKKLRENYNIEARKLFEEGKGAIVGCLVDASITPLLVDHGIFSK